MNIVADNQSLRVTGLDRLAASNCAEFKELIKRQLSADCRYVVLDCTTVRFIDSDGLGTLISIHKQLALHDGKVRLHEPSRVVRQLLNLLHLDEVFEIIP